MKSPGLITCLLLLLTACEYNGLGPSVARPTREIHTLQSTGEQVGVKTFEYDNNGNLTREYFEGSDLANNNEVIYQYDPDGNLIVMKQRDPANVNFNVTASTYRGGLKVSDKQYNEGYPNASGHKYFYTLNRLDSAWSISYLEDGSELHQLTHVYEYNDAGQLVREGLKNDTVCGTFYSYDNRGNLTSNCSGCETLTCTVNEYNSNNQLVKVKQTRFGEEGVIQELFYNEGRLVEKHVTDYPIYGRFDMPVVTVIRYEY